MSNKGLVGRELGGFQVKRLIGAGSMGTVYVAWQPSLRREVALKVLPVDDSTGGDDAQRFRREARLQSRLAHPNLVRIHDQGQEGAWSWIAMELVEGESLGARLRSGGPMTEPEATRLASGIADALHYLHEQGVVHRDIKADNVLIDGRGHVRLSDFGLSRCSEDTLITLQKSMIGTVRYMAPEVFEHGRVDRASDMYSFGVLLYHMVSGAFPHAGEGRELMANILHEPPVPLASVAKVSPILRGLVEDLLAKDGASRPPASQVVERIREMPLGSTSQMLTGEVPVALPQGPKATPPAVSRPRSGRTPSLRLAVLAVFVISITSSVFLWKVSRSHPGPGALASAVPSSPAPPSPVPEWWARREKLLDRFRERLRSMAPRLWMIRPGDPQRGFQARYWGELERRMTPRAPPGLSTWFLVMQPEELDEIFVTASWGDERVPVVGEFRQVTNRDGTVEQIFESAQFQLNGEAVPHTLEPDGKVKVNLPPGRLRPGLNRLWIGPFAESNARKFRASLVENRRRPIDPPREVLDLCLDPGLFEREQVWLEELFGGKWVTAEKRARELSAAYPGDPCAMWQVALSHCLLARALRDIMISTRGAGALQSFGTKVLPIELPDADRLSIDMGASMDQLHLQLKGGVRTRHAWRTLGETLCVIGDLEMGWAAMMYACLLAPDLPDLWYAFGLVYEGERVIEPWIEGRRGEVRDCVLVARDLPLSEHRVFIQMRRHVLQSLRRLGDK